MNFEPYILFLAASVIIVGLVISYFSFKRYEILIVLFAITSIVASLFYDNNPVWITEELESSFKSYFRGGILAFCGIIGISVYFMRYKIHKFKIPVHLILLIIFAIFSFFSVFYSIDFKNTFIRAGLFLSVVLFLVSLEEWIDSEDKLTRTLNLLYLLSVLVIIVNLLSMFAIPSRSWWWKTPSRFLGLFSHPNELGGFTIISFPILLWRFYNSSGTNKIIPTIFLILNLGLLLATGSRTSLIVSFIGIIIWLLLYKEWVKIILVLIIASSGLLVISNINITSYERDEGSNITNLTERESIWEAASVFVKEEPIKGYGYGVEGKIFSNQLLYDMDEQFFNPNAQQPLHNGYLSIFIGGGSIGLLLWMLSIFYAVYLGFSSRFSSFKAYVLATLIPLLIANIVESAVTGYLGSTDIFFWFAWIISGRLILINELGQTSIMNNEKMVNN